MPDPITPLATPSALWSRAKADFLAGVTADEACRRYGLSRSRFFERAKAEGWRRADRMSSPGADADEDAIEGDEPLASARDLADRAWRRAERAIARGRLPEAQGWARLTRDLRRLALDETGHHSWRGLQKSDPQPQRTAAEAGAAPVPVAAPTKPPLTLADVPPEIWNDPDPNAMIAWLGKARDWPELIAEASPQGRAKAGLPSGESGAETAGKTEACPEKPDFPDCDCESAPEPEKAAPPPLTEDPEGWPAWAVRCEQMRREHPDEPWWGEALDAETDVAISAGDGEAVPPDS